MDAGLTALYRRGDIEARAKFSVTSLLLPKSPAGAFRPVQESVPASLALAQLSSPPIRPDNDSSPPAPVRKGRAADSGLYRSRDVTPPRGTPSNG